MDKFSGVIADSFAEDSQLSANGNLSEWQHRVVWGLREAIALVKRDLDLVTVDRNEDRQFVACILQAWDRFTIYDQNMADLLKENISSWLPPSNSTSQMLEDYVTGSLPPGSSNVSGKILPFPENSAPEPEYLMYSKSSIVGLGASQTPASGQRQWLIPESSIRNSMPGSWPSPSMTVSSSNTLSTIYYSAGTCWSESDYESPWKTNQRSQDVKIKSLSTVLSEHQTLLDQRQLLAPDPLRDWSGRGKHVEYQRLEPIPLESLQQIGSSPTAVVDKVRCRRVLLARKSMTCRGRLKLETAINEVEHLQRLSHAHIIQLVGSYLQGRTFSILLYPVADYDIRRFMQDYHSTMSQSSSSIGCASSMVRFFGCLAHALHYIHSNFTKHLDIKPQNILVKRQYHNTTVHSRVSATNYRVYIADFGLSKNFSSLDQSQTDSCTPRTPKYCAPEVYYQEAKGRSADVFSMGCVFLEMMTVIHGKSLEDLDELIRSPDATLSYRENIPRILGWLDELNKSTIPWDTWVLGCRSKFARARKAMMLSMISKMLDQDKEKRPLAAELSQSIGTHTCCGQGQEPFAIEDNQNELQRPTTPQFTSLKHDVSWFDNWETRRFLETLIVECLNSDFSDLHLVSRAMDYAFRARHFLYNDPMIQHEFHTLSNSSLDFFFRILNLFRFVGQDINLCMDLQQFLPPSYVVIRNPGPGSSYDVAFAKCGASLRRVPMPHLDLVK